jgi:MFS-type transporter involved in bile tolerance (Atg22 family)
MLLIPAAQRGSLNAIYQTGATAGALVSAWLYSLQTDFTSNATSSTALFVVSGLSLWQVARQGGVRPQPGLNDS